jgi:hypothetical protein
MRTLFFFLFSLVLSLHATDSKINTGGPEINAQEPGWEMVSETNSPKTSLEAPPAQAPACSFPLSSSLSSPPQELALGPESIRQNRCLDIWNNITCRVFTKRAYAQLKNYLGNICLTKEE